MVEGQQASRTLTLVVSVAARPQYGLRSRSLGFARQHPIGLIAGLALVVLGFIAIGADVVAPYSPTYQYFSYPLEPPGFVTRNGEVFLLGTDSNGRDVFSRVIHGARISLSIGFGAILIGTTGGLVLALLSAYRGGKTDMVIQRVMDSMLAIPVFLMAVMLVAVLGRGLAITALVIGITQIPRANRVIRSHALTIMQEPFIDAARAIGASEFRILTRYLAPNVMATVLIVASTSIGGAIVAESGLSFLGLAAGPPLASWGNMIGGDGRIFLETSPWLVIAPGVALSLMVLAFNFFGDAMRDALDPRLRGR